MPLRASAGFRERFLTDVGHAAFRPVRYVPEREAKLRRSCGPVFKGALRDWEIPGSDEHPPLSCASPTSIPPRKRPRSLTRASVRCGKAEDALERMRNGLGGRYYKTREQVERRIGQILGVNITGLIDVTVTTRTGS